MDRRDSLKTLLIGAIGGATVGATGCQNGPETVAEKPVEELPLYGRTPEEKKRDEELMSQVFLNDHELETIAILCDIILPATNTAGSATDAETPAFIEFIAKDIPQHQLPIRGGLMWLDSESNRRFNKVFKTAAEVEQIQIIEDIAYPDPDNEKPQLAYGIRFFDLMRGLTLTGYYTSKIGIEDLGYVGNQPGIWDGVPAEVLADHDVDYDPEWLAKCVDQRKQGVIAEWDEEGNLLT